MTGDLYIESVIKHVPHGQPVRDHIASDLRSHIAERTEQGQAMDEVLRQLGDPLTLAESYLAAVPLESASLVHRVVAKLIDFIAVAATVAAVAALLWTSLPQEVVYFIPPLAILLCVLCFVAYTVFAEYEYGYTVGKRLMQVRVVRESGARISLGQAIVRQLPFFGQFFWIDALFALFTERKQRAFEMLSKTRAVSLLLSAIVFAS